MMIFFRRAMLRTRAILRRRSLDDDMQSEMRVHLERSTDRLIGRGMSAADARIAARREFGNVAVLQEDARDARGGRWVDALAGDIRFAFRYFARHKTMVGIIVVVLALGTGANAMIFSIFQAEFLRPPPALAEDEAAARIVVRERATRTGRWEPRLLTHPELLSLAERPDVFGAVIGWTTDDVVLDVRDSSGARGVTAQFVTPNYFAGLGVRLAAGQGFSRSSEGPALAAVLSHTLAAQLSPNASDVVGRRILVNEMPVHIVGVAPPRFQGALHNMDEPALWIPASARADIARLSPRWLAEEPAFAVLARLAPDVSREQATALARQVVMRALPDSATRVGMARTAYVLGRREPTPGADRYEVVIAFTAIALIGVLVLLVAWMNVSSLMVAAAVGRRHEIAVRLSLGASRIRLLRQLVTESTLLALAGGTLGLILAWWVLAWNQAADVNGVDIIPDFGTLLFVLAIALATGILFGLSPALHATRGGVAGALRDSGAGSTARSRLQRVFVGAQIMLSQPLLVVLGVLLSLVITDYQPMSPAMSRQVINIRFRPLLNTGAPGQRREAVDSLIPRIAARPEVLDAVPASTAFGIRGVLAPDRVTRDAMGGARGDSIPTIVHLQGTAPGWFALLDVPILLGRDVTLADTAESSADHPVVIGSDLARALWGNTNPIGRTLASPPLSGLAQDSVALTVVGVYDATRQLPGMTFNGQTARSNTTFRAFTARGKHWQRDRVLVRTRAAAEPFLPELQRFVRESAPSLPVASMMTLEQIDTRQYRDTLRMAMMAGAGGALALLLASLGLYGVVSLSVQQRTREIGIRIAVGAAPMRVARGFLASGVRLGALALGLGLPLSIAALKVAISQGVVIAPGVNVWGIGVVIAVLLLAVASAATWVPARRAARVDPSTTLRIE